MYEPKDVCFFVPARKTSNIFFNLQKQGNIYFIDFIIEL
jgi:hypothetical protein